MIKKIKQKLNGWWRNYKFEGIDMDLVTPDPNFPDHDYYPFYYRGIRVEQNPHIFKALDETVKAGIQPVRIFEIGYRNGGFTLLLDDHPISDKAEKIYAYDKIATEKAPVSAEVERVHGDFFQKVLEVGELIKQDGLSMVFCDGGDKNAEFNFLAPFLKEGDIMLTHDYAPNEEIWKEEFLGKKWDWFESWDGELDNACRDYNLVNFMENYWNDAVWSCKRKYNETI